MTGSPQIIFYAAATCIVVCVTIVSYIMATPTTTEVSALGERGYQRQLARKSALFVVCEPGLRLVAAWFATLPMPRLRPAIDSLLRQAGNYLGLTADEFLALSLMTAAGGALLCGQVFPQAVPMLLAGTLTAGVPYLLVSAERNRRAVQVTRALPSAIELVALCVSAGMDFPGALREVIGPRPENDDVLNGEFRQLLRDLDLGHSRRQALLAFRDRVAGEGISDFCAALIQSEEKGNPLKEVLTSQAKMLRIRRSFRAEELATQAGVKMVIPLALLMLMVLTLIITPLLIKVKEEGF